MLILKFLQQIDDLALDRNVQSRNRLVADDKFRFYRQSPGNTDTLPLPSGKLMRKTVGMFSVEAYCLQQFIDSLGPFFLIVHFMDLHTLGNNASNRHTGIQRSIRILENDLCFSGILITVFGVLHVHFFAVIEDLAFCGRVNPHYHTSQGGLSAAGLTYHTQGLAFINIKGNIIDCHQSSSFSYVEMFGHMV